ncbi:hypothetical protein BHF71_03745 [Vulcanibacillus modesticaldus]|uniref:LysM domain-containing protein n=1 Tax=Vulcanibacillus modesticaldus TaxID=337097 RepID=A0A1D2YSF8_9BACI|nr:LysM peptidoglycan-binding domain-containing protein [Vulcanibacillus modesticaldus]OEF97259.1 hypothetical protein BHF71_03745 [Vulcanibacillus modesticaldus]
MVEDFEREHEEMEIAMKTDHHSLPPRSTIHGSNEYGNSIKINWNSAYLFISSFVFIVVIASLIFFQLSGHKSEEVDIGLQENNEISYSSGDSLVVDGQENIENNESTIEEDEDLGVTSSSETDSQILDGVEQTTVEVNNDDQDATIHVVAPGENLFRISLKYFGSGEYVEALAKYNGLADVNDIYAGFELKIPSKEILDNID